MYLKKIEGPRVVTSEDGRIISRADLPPRETTRWVARRKQIVVDAVWAGLLPREEALEMYRITDAEFSGWEHAAARQGRVGLKANRQKALVAIQPKAETASRDAAFQLANLTLDPSRQDACLGEQPLQLTGIEFKVLNCLAINSGRVVSRVELMKSLYGDGPVPGLRILNVVICRLRSKIEEAADAHPHPLIETVWGRGYALQLPAA